MIKLVIFDLDDCLVNTWEASFPITIREAINVMVKEGLGVDSVDNAVDRLAEINSNSSNCPEAITEYLNEIGADPAKYMEVGKRAIYAFNLENLIKLNLGVVEMLEKLSFLGVDLVIVTKGWKERQMKIIEATGIDKSKFKRIYIVTDYDKTEPYKRAMEELGHPAENTLVVGDRYETDLIPGKNLGTKVVWVPRGRGKINPPKKEDVDYIINDFREILEIVGGQ